MKKTARALRLFITIAIICSLWPTTATAALEGGTSAKAHMLQDLYAYQDVIDRLNEEYGYSMSFAPELFTRNHSYKSPQDFTISEFEKTLRRDIQEDIAVNLQTQMAVAALGDVKWENVPFTGKVYKAPPNVTYMSSPMLDMIYNDADPNISNLEAYNIEIKANEKTVSSIQPKLDPTKNVAFLIHSTISIPDVWRYKSVSGFSVLDVTGQYPRYYPTAMSHSYLDSYRTTSATFTCTHYNDSGVIINRNAKVYREFHASSDCFTNSPNYSIPKTYTNQTYNHINDFCMDQNCAGYAWNYDAPVNMISLGITYAKLNQCTSLSSLHQLVKDKSETYMSNKGITASRIVPNSNIYSNPDSISWTTWWFGDLLHSDFYRSTPSYYKITR